MRKKFPEQPEEVFEEYVSDWRAAYGEAVEAILFYGSGARGEYAPGVSDLNFLIVLTDDAIGRLRPAINLSEKWRKRARVVPLVITRQYIHNSLDSYPVEFLHMKRHYRVLFGADVLSELAIQPQHLRLQLERELKGKLLHLRKGFIESGYDRDELLGLIQRTIKAFLPLFEALLYLKQETIPAGRKEIFEKVVQAARLDAGFIDKIFHAVETDVRPYREELWQVMEDYLAQIRKLTLAVDAMA